MANAEKWRPVIIATGALIVVATVFVWPRQPVRKQPAGHTYEECLKLAWQLKRNSTGRLKAAPPQLRPALRAVVAQSEVELYTLLKITPAGYFPEDTSIWNGLRQIATDLRSVEAGADPFARRPGRFVRGYQSSIGGLQGYSINIPADHDFSSRAPLVVHLHGFGNADRWHIPQAAEFPEAISVAPRAFGPTDFMFIGEADVLDVLEDVKRNYRIDEDRIYLAGRSMGGTGCWSLAVHYPDMFAAIAPIAGSADFRAWAKPEDLRPANDLQRMLVFQKKATSATFLVENLINVPVYCIQGGDDTIVLPMHSRIAMAGLKKAGGTERVYWEFPGFGHGPFPKTFTAEQARWLLGKRRVHDPERVIYKTASLRHSGAYGITILQRTNPAAFSGIEKKRTGGNTIEITAANVSRFQIEPAARLLDPNEITVNINGNAAYQGAPAARLVFELQTAGWRRAMSSVEGIVKQKGLSGPIEDAFLSPFMIVHGGGEAVSSGAIGCIVGRWARRVSFPVKNADNVTDEDIVKYNLILLGNPETNSLMAQVMRKLPIRLDGNTITCGDRAYAGGDLGMKMCYPNPLNPQRYVVVMAAAGYNGMFQINNRFGSWFPWAVYNHREWFDYAIFDDKTLGPESFLEVGFFDSRWALTDTSRWRRNPRGEYPERNVPHLQSIAAAPDEFHLTDLRPAAYSTEKGPVTFDQQPDGSPILDAEQKERRGLMVTGPAAMIYKLNGEVKEMTFTPWVPGTGGEDDTGMSFAVIGDNRQLLPPTPVQSGLPSEPVTVQLEGIKKMTLRVTRAGGRKWHYLPAVWLDPILRKK